MRFGKLTDGVLHDAPIPLTVDGRVHYHPSEAVYRQAGYKRIKEAPYPEAAEGAEARYYAAVWVEETDVIQQVWEEREPPAAVVPEPTMEARMRAAEAETARLREEVSITMAALDAILMGEV